MECVVESEETVARRGGVRGRMREAEGDNEIELPDELPQLQRKRKRARGMK